MEKSFCFFLVCGSNLFHLYLEISILRKTNVYETFYSPCLKVLCMAINLEDDIQNNCTGKGVVRGEFKKDHVYHIQIGI